MENKKMKCAVIYEAGGCDKFVIEKREIPEIKEGWSLVKIKGFGINHSEIFTRQGLSPSVKFPRILGIECVGIVEKTSDEAKIPVGSKIVSIMGEMGRDFDGSYAEYVLLPNNQIYTVNTNLDWELLASVPETYYTAFGSMKNLQINDNEKILVRGASSGVGVAFLKLVKAKFKNVKVFGTIRKNDETKMQKLKNIGFDEIVIDENNKLETEEKFNKILELVGAASIKNSFEHILENGIICNTGQLGGKWRLENFDPIIEIKNNSYLTSFYSQNVSHKKIQGLFDFIKKYDVNVKPDKIFSLEEIGETHKYLESGKSLGKVIVLN